MYTLLIFYALLAVGFSFLCSIAEAVLLSVTPSFIVTLKDQGSRSAALLEKLKSNVDRPLSAILSLNTVAHTVGAAGVGAEAAEIWGGDGNAHALGWTSAFMTLAILVLSEIIPKTLGAVYWRQLAGPVALFTSWLIWVLYPLVFLSEYLTTLIAGSHREEIVTRDEVAAMAALSAEGGYINAGQSEILQNLFKLDALVAEDVMTPRTVIRAFPQSMTVQEVIDKYPRLAVSRIPIYSDSIDKITGFALKSDIYLEQANDQHDTKLEQLRREIKTIPSRTPLSELFDILLNERAHIAIVIDRYGGTDGLVTLEDVIETLLGLEIVDEADKTDDMQRFARKQWEKRAAAMGLTDGENESQPSVKDEEKS